MKRNAHSWPLLVLVAMAGCATTRGTLDVAIEMPPDPGSEVVFQAPSVVDARSFEKKPPDPSIPSLKNADEIGNPAITSRAIARKRNSYGMAMGDILLPEGQTVAALAAEAIIRGFRSAGYSVLRPEDPGYATAIPVEARIDQFWAWVTPGFWAMAIEFETRMQLVSDVGSFADGDDVRGYVRLKSAAVSSGKWRTTIERGLQDFSASLASSLAGARRMSPASAEGVDP